MSLFRKYLLLGVGILLLAVFSFALISSKSKSLKNSPSPTPQQLTKLKLGRGPVPIHSLAVLVAQKEGIFTKNGLRVEDSPIIGGAANALVSGQVQYQVQPVASFLSSDLKGSGARWISTIVRADRFHILSAKQPDQIKTIGVNRLGGEDYFETAAALKLLGKDITQLEPVITNGYEGKLPILTKGGADAVGLPLTSGYFDTQNLPGVKTLLDLSADDKSYYPIGLLALEKTINDSPQTAKKIADSLAQAVSFIRDANNKQEVLSVLKKEYSVDEKSAQKIYEGFITGTNNLDPKPKVEFVSELLKLMEKDAPEAKTYNPQTFIKGL